MSRYLRFINLNESIDTMQIIEIKIKLGKKLKKKRNCQLSSHKKTIKNILKIFPGKVLESCKVQF